MLKALSLILIAAPMLAITWAYGGTRAPVSALVMPWAIAACLVGTFVLPQRKHGEKFSEAAGRVFKSVIKDKFTYLALAFLILLAIPLFNVGLCEKCDAEAIAAGASALPPFRYLPFCVNVREHGGLFWLFAPALVSALGIKHGLSRGGRRAFIEVFVWNAAALAVLGFAQIVTGAQFTFWEHIPGKIPFFSVFGYVNMGASFFVLAYAVSLGVWVRRVADRESVKNDINNESQHLILKSHYPFVAVSLNLCAALATLSRAAIVLVVAITAVFFLYLVLRGFTGRDWRRARRFRSNVTCMVLFLCLWGVIYIYAPPEVLREVRTVNTFTLADRMSGKAQYHTRVASAMMRNFPIFGVGGWGYRHFQSFYLTKEDQEHLQVEGGAIVHNDYMQFLAEHGVVGFSLLALCFWFLLSPLIKEWRKRAQSILRAERSGMTASTSVVFAVPAPVIWGVLGIIAVLIHAFGDCPLRSGAVMTGIFSVVAAAFGYIPHADNEEDQGGGALIHDDNI